MRKVLGTQLPHETGEAYDEEVRLVKEHTDLELGLLGAKFSFEGESLYFTHDYAIYRTVIFDRNMLFIFQFESNSERSAVDAWASKIDEMLGDVREMVTTPWSREMFHYLSDTIDEMEAVVG